MEPQPRRHRRVLLPLLAALVLTIEGSSGAFAWQPGAVAGLVEGSPAAGVAAGPVTPSHARPIPFPRTRPAPANVAVAPPSWFGASAFPRDHDLRADRSTPAAAPVAPVETAPPPPPAPAATPAPKPQPPKAPTYRGTNHMWIPALGMSRAVAWFPCERSQPPGNHMYRWGCAGTNNVYLMAHAATVFKPLHDAYVRGRLKQGMEVVYADAKGRVTTYAVSYWKVVRPDGDVAWAYAGQSRPSMTLQTCVGKNSEHRLVVRLVAKG